MTGGGKVDDGETPVRETDLTAFGDPRACIIGASMLAFGRALGETIAVLLIISPAFELNFRVLSVGTMTVSALIADQFGEASKAQLSALLAAGFVLFLITLLVNTIAAVLVNRSRSGAATEI